MKHHFPVRLVDDLHHTAGWAKAGRQLKEVFFAEILLPKKAVGDRHFTKRDEWFVTAFAYSALRHRYSPLQHSKYMKSIGLGFSLV
jgi:hypothetical protein